MTKPAAEGVGVCADCRRAALLTGTDPGPFGDPCWVCSTAAATPQASAKARCLLCQSPEASACPDCGKVFCQACAESYQFGEYASCCDAPADYTPPKRNGTPEPQASEERHCREAAARHFWQYPDDEPFTAYATRYIDGTLRSGDGLPDANLENLAALLLRERAGLALTLRSTEAARDDAMASFDRATLRAESAEALALAREGEIEAAVEAERARIVDSVGRRFGVNQFVLAILRVVRGEA